MKAGGENKSMGVGMEKLEQVEAKLIETLLAQLPTEALVREVERR